MQSQSSYRRVPFGYRWTKGRLVAKRRAAAASLRRLFGRKPGAILYARTAVKDERGSIPAQLADGRALAKREGLQVLAEYSEQSPSTESQPCGPELAAALRHAEALGASLIVQRCDRLSRQTKQLLELALCAKRAGFRLRSVQDDATLASIAAAMVDRQLEQSRRKVAAGGPPRWLGQEVSS